MIHHAGQLFGLELKSFANQRSYREALIQAAKYGQQLRVTSILKEIENLLREVRLSFNAIINWKWRANINQNLSPICPMNYARL
ncbi:MAG: hypothetical protein ABFS56_11265 [Pseudomonadota bacterium]